MAINNDVIEEMESLVQRWEGGGDKRAIFLGCYLRMTRNMMQALEDNQFRDRVWVSDLLHHFAAYYFNALDAYDRRRSETPLVWQRTFATAEKPDTPVLSHLLLGVNAHINYDLVLALVDLLDSEWVELSPDGRENRHADHTQVNKVIAATVDIVQDEVVERYAPEMDLVDKLLGPIDEWAASRLIAEWRENVWDKAVQMLEADNDQVREQLRQEIESAALRRARYFDSELG